ncbi:MAG: sulfurtransferase [Betaproteobacteria bacterium]|nr:MAG: sulfurtransferase [Betaproteobacteria bacterium]
MTPIAHTTLVSTAELAAHLDDPAWAVFDCRHSLSEPDSGAEDYAHAHIPGARFIHLDRDLSAPVNGTNGRHPLPDAQTFMRRLEAAGIDSSKQVVAYDAQTGVYAARLWWMLRWVGHEKVAVLDGGYAKWMREGHPQSAAVPQPAPARFSGQPRAITADVEDVLRSLGRPGRILIDARAPDRFRGENETLDPVGGRIPGSINRCFRDNLDSRACFKPAAELAGDFAALLGNAPPEAVVHSCGSGVTACHNLLAMEIAGLHGSRLYPGSWSEWCSDPSRPTEKG